MRSNYHPILNKRVLVLLLLSVTVVLSFFLNTYQLHLIIFVLYYSYLCLSWNIIAGYGGQLSLGHTTFYGIGGYTTAMLFTAWGLTPWLGMMAGAFLAALAGLAVGYLCFRYKLKGIFFALVTLGISEICRVAAMELDFLGASRGLLIPLESGNSLYNLQFTDKKGYFFWILALLVLAVLVNLKIKNSRFGYYLQAIKNDEEAGQALGINVNRYKLYAIMVSAAMTALAGAFYAQYTLFIQPEHMFGLSLNIEIVLRSIIGGIGTISGAIIGSIVMEPIGELSRTLFGSIQGFNLLTYSIVMGVIILVLPHGLVNIRLKKLRENPDE